MLLSSHWYMPNGIHVSTICIHQSLFLPDHQCARTLCRSVYLLIFMHVNMKKGVNRSGFPWTVEKHRNQVNWSHSKLFVIYLRTHFEKSKFMLKLKISWVDPMERPLSNVNRRERKHAKIVSDNKLFSKFLKENFNVWKSLKLYE